MYDEFEKMLNSSHDAPEFWLQGLERYNNSKFTPYKAEYETIWQREMVECLRVNQSEIAGAPYLLIVPSLINRYYILDLSKKLSFVQFLANSGVNVLLLNWNEPSAAQANLDAAGYVTHYLQPLLQELSLQHESVHLMGYCVGGLLSLAGAIISPQLVKSLILLATPWDFSKNEYNNALWNRCQNIVTSNWCDNSPLVSGAYLSWLFYLADPQNFAQKYNNFNGLAEGGEAFERFLAVEHWVNDTVALTSAFARNCLIDWSQHNITARGEWRVKDQPITSEKLKQPALIIAPKHDKIVPPQNALAIAHNMPNATILTPPTGHIGAIIGRARLQNLWQPLLNWVLKN